MGIINYTSGDIPFLTNYEPYSPANGTVVCDYIEEMLSFDLRSRPLPTKINYFVGAENSYVTTLKIKNITLNATLNVTVDFSQDVFFINGNKTTNKLSTDLYPGNVVEYFVELNKDRLNSNTQAISFPSNILLTVKNYNNGSMTVRQVTAETADPLNEKFLPTEITVE